MTVEEKRVTMWKNNPNTPDEGGVRVPDKTGFNEDPDSRGEVHVASVKGRARRHIVCTAVAFIVLFAVMAVYFCGFAIVNQRELFDNGYNSRVYLLAEHNRMGTVFSADGEVLAESDENNIRSYPQGTLFCHAVGFSDNGGSGLEDYMRYNMMHSDISFKGRIGHDRNKELYPGNNVYTTLDTDLQRYAYEALSGGGQGFRGAVLITEPTTGKIRAMVSLPGFDPEDESQILNYMYSEDVTDAPLVNRVTQGAYPPGSTFKIVDAIELLQEDSSAMEDYSFDCQTGTYGEGEESIHCFDYEHHGEQNLEQAFAHSCNSAFADIVANHLDKDRFRKTLKKLMFNRELPYDLPCIDSTSQLLNEPDISRKEELQVAIGQGSTLVSPLHMNMITMAVANRGVLMRPYMVESVRTAEDTILEQYQPREAAALMNDETADSLRVLMGAVTSVTHNEETGQDVKGTASEFDGTANYRAFGKTGTAEYGSDTDSHAWFTGFTVADEDRENGEADLCITVVIENGGVGSDKAVPVAKRILDQWYGEY